MATNPYTDIGNFPLGTAGQGTFGGITLGNLGASVPTVTAQSTPATGLGGLGGSTLGAVGGAAQQIYGDYAAHQAQKLNEQNTQYSQQQQAAAVQRQNAARGSVMPGEMATLGYSPAEAQQMASQYTDVPVPGSNVTITGNAHVAANNFVQGTQNPFDQSMANVDNQISSGQMSASQGQQQKNTLVQNYLTALKNFGGQGGNNPQVASQAMKTFTQWYGDPSNYGYTPNSGTTLGAQPQG